MTLLRTGAATLVALATTGAALALPAVVPHAAAAEPSALASGLFVRDIDGGTLQAPTASVGWSAGAEVSGEVAATATPSSLRSGYVITTTGTRTIAGSTGARTVVDEARIELRGRVPLTLRGLTVGCAPGGRSFVTVDQLLVGDVDRTSSAQEPAGTTIPLPATAGAYDDDATVTLESTTTAGAARTTTGLRIANGDNYEVRDLALGQVTCSTGTQPSAVPHRVAGVQVLGGDGVRLVEPAPVITGPGAASVAAEEVRALGVRSRATGVSAATSSDGSVDVAVEAFAQLPDEDSLAEYRPSALRVNHLHLHVTASGASSVTFDDSVNALFADGRWLNHQDGYIYSKVDEDGEVLLEVRVNERIEHGDGTTTINALRYVDHTGAWPEVILGQVVVGADDPGTGPQPEPQPQPEGEVVPAGTRHAYGVRATGSVDLDAAALVRLDGTRESTVPAVTDSTGQVRATDVRTTIAADGATSSLAGLDLFPGTDAAVHLRDLSAVATAAGTVVSTGGGTVLGHPVAPGPVAPGTTYRLEGTSTTVVLGATTRDGAGLAGVHGLVLTSPEELATTVTAASLTAGDLAAGSTSVVATPLARKTSFGQRARLRLRVAGATAGTVEVADGDRVVASGTVRDATADLALPRRLGAGSHLLDVRFTPSGGAGASSSVVTVRVVKARPRLVLSRSGSGLQVRLRGLPLRPRGLDLTAYAGRDRLASRHVSGATTRLALPGLARGVHRVRVVLAATADSVRATRTVRVRTR